MSDQQLRLRVADTRASGTLEKAPSIVQRIAGSHAGSQMTAQPETGPRVWLAVAIIVLAVGLASVWTFLARDQMKTSMVAETSDHLIAARKAFDALRVSTQANLASSCRVLVEDPRLKATLATEGMDAATVADILQDLSKLRRSGFLLILSPTGRVFAQAGASELEGLDLSASAVVKAAKDADDATVGSWVLAGKVMDLSIKSIRYGESLVAYLVVGQPVDQAMLASVNAQTGVAIASALANKVGMASSNDPVLADVFTRSVAEAVGPLPRVVTSNGQRFVASVVELPETAQAHRLILVGSLDTVAQRFRVLEWMVFIPPVLVLLAAIFVFSAIRSHRRIS
jgi:hypothetical protein